MQSHTSPTKVKPTIDKTILVPETQFLDKVHIPWDDDEIVNISDTLFAHTPSLQSTEHDFKVDSIPPYQPLAEDVPAVSSFEMSSLPKFFDEVDGNKSTKSSTSSNFQSRNRNGSRLVRLVADEADTDDDMTQAVDLTHLGKQSHQKVLGRVITDARKKESVIKQTTPSGKQKTKQV
jgi:hypothetical protein